MSFYCQSCGTSYSKWVGKCDGCLEWNTVVEEKTSSKGKKKGFPASFTPITHLSSVENNERRHSSGWREFDRVCGGGIVPGSVILVGGDPGIGKSTLLLQIISALSQKVPCAYVSGEEALTQIKLRAERLKVPSSDHLFLTSSTRLNDIFEGLNDLKNPQVVIVDSIQTLYSDEVDGAPGTVSQIRSITFEWIQWAKSRNCAVILVGHVTKEGVLAGPRLLEHMVDTVLYFEGDRQDHCRILRAVKNRFGATDEMGVFAMTGGGLKEILNPSELFLSHHATGVPGSVIFAGIEGTRPLLCEIQALVAPSYLASPRRTLVGWDTQRLAMVLAVLETRCGIKFGQKDVFLNVVGGLKIQEPAADMAVAASLLSSYYQKPLPEHSVFFGEVGLSGEVRNVYHTDWRLKEAEKLGFPNAFYGGMEGAHKIKTVNELHHLVKNL